MLAWDCLEVTNRIRIRSVLSASISLELIQPPQVRKIEIGGRWTQNFSFFLWHKNSMKSHPLES